MALKRAPEGLQVLPDGRGASKQRLPLREITHQEGPFSFLQWEASHTHLQLELFFAFLKLVFCLVGFPTQGGFHNLIRPFGHLDSNYGTHSRTMVFSQVIWVSGFYLLAPQALETPYLGLKEAWRSYWSIKAFEDIGGRGGNAQKRELARN